MCKRKNEASKPRMDESAGAVTYIAIAAGTLNPKPFDVGLAAPRCLPCHTRGWCLTKMNGFQFQKAAKILSN
jgi:hypothetical protein